MRLNVDSLVTNIIRTSILVVAIVSSPLNARPFTVDDLVSLDRVSEPTLLPSGNSVVFAVRETHLDINKGRTSLYQLDLTRPNMPPQRLTPSNSNANSPQFSADSQYMYFLSSQSGSSQLYRLNLKSHEPEYKSEAISQLPLDVDAYWLSPDQKHILLSVSVFADCETLQCTADRLKQKDQQAAKGQIFNRLFIRHWDEYSDGRRSQLYLASLDSNGKLDPSPIRLTHVDGDIPSKPFGGRSEVQFSPDGKNIYYSVRIANHSEPWSTNFDVFVMDLDGGNIRNLTADNLAWDSDPLISKDGKTLYYRAMSVPGAEADRFKLMSVDVQTGVHRAIANDFDRSIGELKWSYDGKSILTTADDHGRHLLFQIDLKTGKVTALTHEGHVGDFSISPKGIILTLDSLMHPADLYQLSTEGQLTKLTHFNQERLATVEFSKPTTFTFKGYNDEWVQGTVFKPIGFKEGQKYPVAFLIHGGPQGSWLDSFSYRWNPQTYTGLGYAVVTIDFHGSTGYGQAFTDSISGHWGDRPLEDLQKGWSYALSQYTFLDGANACALGASYGGFMINWIAGHWHTPKEGAWRCLVNHDGIFDSRSMYYTTEELWFEEHENLGTPWTNPEAYEKFNPVLAASEWRVPMLVVQGALDYRVPIGQGIGSFTLLQRRGIDSQLLLFPNENHWVLTPENSIQWHHTVQEWLSHWLQH